MNEVPKMTKPRAVLNEKLTGIECVKKMMEIDVTLFDRCMDTANFAYYMTQLIHKSVHFDYVVNTILPNYIDDEIKLGVRE